MAQIELDGVGKTYWISKRGKGLSGAVRGVFHRERTAVHALTDMSFSIERGELVGYIGPNGAGKSTTIKLMSGILKPDAGDIRVLSRVPWSERREHVKHIGVVFGQRSQLWWDTPVIDSFSLLSDIYKLDKRAYKARLDELCAMLNVEEFLSTPVRQLSLGQRMRCELIASLIHDPEILFLDEPTIGLDAVTKLKLRAFLKSRNQRGITMILTTHDMDDIEALCSRVMVIGKGRKLFDGDMESLRRLYAPVRVLKARVSNERARLIIPEADSVNLRGHELEIKFRPESVSAQALITRAAEAAGIEDLTIEAEDVEQMVADMYRELNI